MYRLASLILRHARPGRQPVRRSTFAPSIPISDSSSTNTPEQRLRRASDQRPDWREWFRSTHCDDAWSPYIPFLNKGEGSPSSVAKLISGTQSDPVNALLEGRWQKRRHGMNLEPLHLHQRVSDEEEDADDGAIPEEPDKSSMHSNESSAEERTSDEIQQAVATAKARLKWLDSQTRFLCSMLDDLYRTGIRRQIDRARTERCHRIIGKLLSMTPARSREKYNQHQHLHPFTFTGLAPRAAAILERMERCSPVSLRNVNTNPANHDFLQSWNSSRKIGVPQHLPYTKHVLPHPTIEIYNMVLLLYAKESGPIHIAQEAEDVIWSMIERFIQQTNLNTNQTEKNIIPSKDNWNCVLTCWSMSTDPFRAFHSYSFLKSWIEWNKQEITLSHREEYNIDPDLESYCLVLQSCVDYSTTAHTVSNEGQESSKEKERATEVGSGVSIRLMQQLEKTAIALDSRTYYLALRAICQTSEVLSSTSKVPALSSMTRVFRKCCQDGLLTTEILEVVRMALTDLQFAQLTGNKTSFVDVEKNAVPTEEIMKSLPPEWIQNATLI